MAQMLFKWPIHKKGLEGKEKFSTYGMGMQVYQSRNT
jgi:hypothetical protein